VTGLNASRRAQFGVRPYEGPKNQPLPGGLFETRFRFLDRGISFQCGLENLFKGNGVRCVPETNYEKQDKKVNNGPL
jgi:hypothetical protein